MNSATVPCRGFRSHRRSHLATLLGALGFLAIGPVTVESVDSELLPLNDGFASAFKDPVVIESFDSDALASIAVSLSSPRVISAGHSNVLVWMSIGSDSEASSFATRMRSLAEPKSGNFSHLGQLAQGLVGCDNETGAAGNGFRSALHITEVSGATKPTGKASPSAPARVCFNL